MRSQDPSQASGLPVAPKIERLHRALGVASVLLSLVGFVYLIYGVHGLFTEAGDYKLRWVEQHYVFQGKNPLDVLEWGQAAAHHRPHPDNGRDGTMDPNLGLTTVGYPPWAYFTGAALTWEPTFEGGRFVFGVLNLALLAGLIAWAYRLGAKENLKLACFFAASLFAVNSIYTTFLLGQYGVLVMAALVAAYLFDEKDNWLASGLCLGIAMTKVTLAGPFVLPFLIKFRWRVLLVMGVYLLLGSLVIWPIIKTNPLEMLGQMLRSSSGFQELGYSLNNLLELAGVDVQPATKLAALLSLTIAMVLLYLWRSSSMLTLYAIAALATRAWSYHALYDNLILAFIWLDLAIATWRTQSRLGLLSFVLFGLSLWMPGRLTHTHAWLIAQWVIWVEGLVVLLYLKRSEASFIPSRAFHPATESIG